MKSPRSSASPGLWPACYVPFTRVLRDLANLLLSVCEDGVLVRKGEGERGFTCSRGGRDDW